MKRLLFLLLLVSQIAYGQKVTTYGGKALTYGGDVATYAYCDEYQAVYDAYTVKPSDAVAAIDNTMVSGLVSDGAWAKLDVVWVYASHTNGAGEALLDWKQPTGGASLLDAGKGTFDSGTESWVAHLNNTIENDIGALKITYVDGADGGKTNFQNAGDLNSDLVIGKTYRVRARAKVNTGASVVLRATGAATVNLGTITSTSYAWYEAIIVASSTTGNYIQASSMGAGEIIWIDEWYIQEWTNATAYNAPTFTALEGFLGNGTTQYTDGNWNPSVNGVNYVQNSASQIIYIRTNINSDGLHGINGSADIKNCFIGPRLSDNNAYIKTNDNTDSSNGNADGSGMYINTRTAAAVNKLYKNSSAIINATVTSIGVPTHNPYCLAYNNDDVATGFRADQVSLYAFGAGLTQTDVNNLTNRFETRMDALGKGVIP